MKRIVLLGRGGAGKSTLSRKLGEITDIPVVELDKHFWGPDLSPLSKERWIALQKELAAQEKWIMDGDLGKYDVLSERLRYADTVIVLNFPLWICLKRAFKRSEEQFGFWWWLITWRIIELPKILRTIKDHAPGVSLVILKNQHEVDNFLSKVS